MGVELEACPPEALAALVGHHVVGEELAVEYDRASAGARGLGAWGEAQVERLAGRFGRTCTAGRRAGRRASGRGREPAFGAWRTRPATAATAKEGAYLSPAFSIAPAAGDSSGPRSSSVTANAIIDVMLALLGAAASFFLLALCAAVYNGAKTDPELARLHPRDLWRVDGKIDRGPYLLLGFGLMAVKFNLERTLASALFNRPWSVLAHYLHAPAVDIASMQGLDGDFYRALALTTLPFVWTGMALTVRRLRSAGLPPALSLLFFVPFVNFLFFLLLSALPRVPTVAPGRALDRFVPRSKAGSAAMAAGLGGAVTLVAAPLWDGVSSGYTAGLFIGFPFALGMASGLLYGWHEGRAYLETLGAAALTTALAALAVFAAAVEGLVCIVMAAPLAFLLVAMGATVGWFLQKRGDRPALPVALLFLGLPVLTGFESASAAPGAALPVRTAVTVDAPPEAVWRNVVSFSELPEPDHWMFRLGFAYPVRATISGRGVGAVRRSEFTTGAFVEPITAWEEPRRLAFSVTSQPPPMRETSWVKDLRPRHLEGFLVSEGGEFRLSPCPAGARLTGTTWYRHAIAPEWYWRPWSDAVIHRIHARVLATSSARAKPGPDPPGGSRRLGGGLSFGDERRS